MPAFDARRLARLPAAELSITGYRNQAAGFDPRSGEGARRFGGRFNPPHSFPVIYLCTTRACVVAELTRRANRQGLTVADLLPREVWRLTVDVTKALDLTDPDTLGVLDIDPADLIRDDLRLPRDIGEAAHEHRFQAIRSRSATGVDDVVAVLPENLAGAIVANELVQVWATEVDIGGQDF